MINVETIFYALIGGVIPAIVWLAFWLYEDYKNPEPKKLLLRSFFFGMLAVPMVIPIQKMIDTTYPNMILIAVLLWVILEEVFKFVSAYFGGIRSSEDNEPVDPIIYMITASLGFVALENTLFILGPLVNNDIAGSILTGNMRFIGASLLHVVSSGIVGIALAFTFYAPKAVRNIAVLVGLACAITFHLTFNLLIMHGGTSGGITAFIMTWVGVVILLLAFEKAKTIAP
ncbi:MAG: PrsW family glutamic-type intramembrane protease [Parcubacteria group bacterium]